MFLLNCIKSNYLLLSVALLLTALYNGAFYHHINEVYPAFAGNSGFLISTFFLIFAANTLIFSFLCIRRLTKPVLVVFVLFAAIAAYYMDTFDVIIDRIMIQNIVMTDAKEASDLITLKLGLYVSFLGLVPVLLIYRYKRTAIPWRRAIGERLVFIFLLLLVAISQLILFSKYYASFSREHKIVRYYINPLSLINAMWGYASSKLQDQAPKIITSLGSDAHVVRSGNERRLIILVVGETARWDHFSLNGYSKQTNPLLSQEQSVSFKRVTSCGTSTGVAVPCMFSPFERAAYSEKKFNASENLLDVLAHAGVTVLWRENNSDSKGVAVRPHHVVYQDYKDPSRNTVCDTECRDEGMLIGLQEFIDQHTTGDIAIILHQMGSHGPAYYKRYPSRFEQFKPACKKNLLEQCSLEEIANAYDNTILYTDYFLSKAIGLLKENTKHFETALFYISDHGESLGEFGVYLHGMPYLIAPEAQTHVGAILWLSDNFSQGRMKELKAYADHAFSQDNLFHTILGMFQIRTKEYKAELDILNVSDLKEFYWESKL
ncbi:phosphoethanolamine--lipid A transferase [Legionella sp. km535]|uniref:phosphoethanolamine transferase n=1 Tax=Legionella sp. km535 TaxID=2498107 RepID=UPI000F8E88A6|nr:phosphoethanolamine--lipid A transferase [Legionella sp. km535]RUR19297.1 phosphoethanolamine--lipid A transferase [Legionella sp. km535]